MYGCDRGDGTTGENVTANILTIKEIPNELPPMHPISSRCAVKSTMAKIRLPGAQCADGGEGKQTYVNPRNTASGSLRQLDRSDGEPQAALLRLCLG